MSRDEYAEDLHAELGYRTAGRRELSQREWYSLRGDDHEPAPTPKAFAVLVNRLRVKKWTKNNPDRKREHANRYASKPEVKRHSIAEARRRRHDRWKASNPARACPGCGVEFCPIAPKRGIQRAFCTDRCAALSHQRRQRREAGQRETNCTVCGEPGHNARRHR